MFVILLSVCLSEIKKFVKTCYKIKLNDKYIVTLLYIESDNYGLSVLLTATKIKWLVLTTSVFYESEYYNFVCYLNCTGNIGECKKTIYLTFFF